MNALKTLTLAIGLLLGANHVSATSASNIGPLAEANDIDVEDVLVGDPLFLGSPEAIRLFARDGPRAERFKRATKAVLIEHLRTGGLPLVATSKYTIGLRVFGGTPLPVSCPSQTVLLLEVWVSGPGDAHTHTERTAMAVIADDAIESTAVSFLTEAVDGFLAQRAQYRDRKK
jgi:hypothetical protein